MNRNSVFAVIFLTAGFLAGLQAPSIAREDYEMESLISAAVLRVGLLHRLMLGEVESVKRSLAQDIAFDVVALSEPGVLSATDEEQLQKLRVLLGVMDEKMPVEQWRGNSDFQRVVGDSLIDSPELANSFRCRDWGKPMWVAGDCT